MTNKKQSTDYQSDFYAWSQQMAGHLRSGNFEALDIEHLAEEVEALGNRDKRELRSRIMLLLMHLLKWQFQPSHRTLYEENSGRSWQNTIRTQRRDILDIISDSGSLKRLALEEYAGLYQDACQMAMSETGLERSVFPHSCPYEFESELLNHDYWPS